MRIVYGLSRIIYLICKHELKIEIYCRFSVYKQNQENLWICIQLSLCFCNFSFTILNTWNYILFYSNYKKIIKNLVNLEKLYHLFLNLSNNNSFEPHNQKSLQTSSCHIYNKSHKPKTHKIISMQSVTHNSMKK